MAECVGVGGVLLCFPARLFEHAVEHVSDRLASVVLRERDVGAVAWDEERGLGNFEYEPAFVRQGLPVSPLTATESVPV